MDRETTLGRVAASPSASAAARLSPISRSVPPAPLTPPPDSLSLPSSKSSLFAQYESTYTPCMNWSNAIKSCPETWSIDFIDLSIIPIDQHFDDYMGSIGHAHETCLDDADDDNLGLHDANLAFDDCSESADDTTSPCTETTCSSSGASLPDDDPFYEDDDLAYTIADMEIHRLTDTCPIGHQPVCPPATLFSDADLLTRVTDAVDPATRALHSMDLKIMEFKISRSKVYSML
jgi:hypothetical protein